MKNLFRLTWKKSRSWVNIQETENESHAFMVLNGRGNVGRTREIWLRVLSHLYNDYKFMLNVYTKLSV